MINLYNSILFLKKSKSLHSTNQLWHLSKNVSNLSSNIHEKKTSILRIKSTQPCEKSKKKIEKNNFAGLTKHFVPLYKEWDNSIYAYKKETIKILPSNDKIIFNLIKGYLNFYNTKVEKSARSIRARRRKIRSSLNKALVGKPNFKHTNKRVVIMTYYYNRRLKYFFNKINNASTIYNNKNEYKMFINNMKSKIEEIKILMSKHHTLLSRNFNLKTNHLFLNLEKMYFVNTTTKLFNKDINSLLLRQIIYLQESKTNKFYLLPLLKLLETIYDKKVTLNFINIKYIYNSASIISEGIITKLKKRTNSPLRVLRSSLNMFKLPPINRLVLYDDMFNKKVKLQNVVLKELFFFKNNTKKDTLDNFLNNRWTDRLTNNNHKFNLNKVIALLKSKFSSGVRFEMAGRLTRRNVAQRAIHKLVYKGNIKNTDSSQKGLSTTLLRGYAKSNVQFKQSKSKRRIGSFGLKTWISSSN